VKRLGIGESSGHGKTSGKGHKGQKARSGGSLRLGFEGGQMPLIRRLPKRGFNNRAFNQEYAIVNLSDLNQFKEGTVVNEQLLREAKLIRGRGVRLKILGDGELKHGLTVETDRISASARDKIEKAGGTVSLRTATAATDSSAVEPAASESDSSESVAAKTKSVRKKVSPKRKAPAKSGSRKRTSKKS
jgi:large subunit ribosomal protein L15